MEQPRTSEIVLQELYAAVEQQGLARRALGVAANRSAEGSMGSLTVALETLLNTSAALTGALLDLYEAESQL